MSASGANITSEDILKAQVILLDLKIRAGIRKDKKERDDINHVMKVLNALYIKF